MNLHGAEGGDAARVRLPPPLVFLAFAAAGAAAHWGAWRWPVSDAWLPRAIGALATGAAGLLLLYGTLRLFFRSGQDPRPWTPSPEMIVEGPYRRSRNPMYVGMLMTQVSLGLAANSLWIVLLAPPALAVVHFTAVCPEERYLARRFGAGYEEYRRRVRRYL